MVIQAKYPGTCAKCGQPIKPGESINWAKGAGTSHVKCPEQATTAPFEGDTYHLGGGSGYGCCGWRVGEVVRAGKYERERGYPEFLFVLTANKRYIRDDGMSFGVGDESGYIYSATCREATAEESVPLRAEIEARNARVAATKRVDEIKRHIQTTGTRPEGANVAEGETLLDTANIYGGGDWFVVGTNRIWYVRNNGHDGDCWADTNIGTPGYAGAIGWYVARDEQLADELKRLAVIVRA